MPDRVRESVFSILATRFGLPGMLPPLRVADLFAGCGSLGFEAVSRGAVGCEFVERGRLATAALRNNIQRLGAQDSCQIVPSNAWTACLSTPRPKAAYGIIFVDPPYADTRDASAGSKVATLLGDLFRTGWADRECIIILHHQASVVHQPDDRACWTVRDRRVYGTTAVVLLAHADAAPDRPDSTPQPILKPDSGSDVRNTA